MIRRKGLFATVFSWRRSFSSTPGITRRSSISFVPWDRQTDNWADKLDEPDCDFEQYGDFRFTSKIPGL